MAEMKSPNVHAKKNRNDTPRKRKTHIIKVRVTAEEKLRIAYACKELHLTQSELVRRVSLRFSRACAFGLFISAIFDLL